MVVFSLQHLVTAWTYADRDASWLDLQCRSASQCDGRTMSVKSQQNLGKNLGKTSPPSPPPYLHPEPCRLHTLASALASHLVPDSPSFPTLDLWIAKVFLNTP